MPTAEPSLAIQRDQSGHISTIDFYKDKDGVSYEQDYIVVEVHNEQQDYLDSSAEIDLNRPKSQLQIDSLDHIRKLMLPKKEIHIITQVNGFNSMFKL